MNDAIKLLIPENSDEFMEIFTKLTQYFVAFWFENRFVYHANQSYTLGV